MATTIENIIKMYNPKTVEETKAVLREVIQSIVLIGLSKSDFFSKASFYGGTALRIFYGLNRYSEDLDFTLNSTDEDFSLNYYIEKIKEIALSYGLELVIETKVKNIKTPIDSAFAKVNTYQAFISLNIKDDYAKMLHKDEVLKVKFEVDCNPPIGFDVETKWIDLPEFAPIVVLDEASLFSGKIHAILCRSYKNNVKGRDYYDFLFYCTKRIKPNLKYLRNKLIASSKIKEEDAFDLEILKKMLKERFDKIDYNQVVNDASRFVFNNENLSFYTKELFIQMLERL